MPFRFQALTVTYESRPYEETVVTGCLMEGAIEGPEQVVVSTRSGVAYCFMITSIQASGTPGRNRLYPILPGPNTITLGLCGHPPERDVLIPSVLVADGIVRTT